MILIINYALTTDINCFYEIKGAYVLGDIYQCTVNKSPNIIASATAYISSTSGDHHPGKNANNVLGFYAEDKVIQYFPQGLDKQYPNLKMIFLTRCPIKEIHQSDFKPFPKLVSLNLFHHTIEVIEKGLLDFNPELQILGISGDYIIHIDPNVFDHLTKLRYFWFGTVPCIKEGSEDSWKNLQKVIQKIKVQCINSEFMDLERKIDELAKESKELDFEDFNAKIECLEKDFKYSKFAEFHPLKSKFEDLKKLVPFNSNVEDCVESGRSSRISTSLKNLTISQNNLRKDLKDFQSDQKTALIEVKSSLNNMQTSYDERFKNSTILDELFKLNEKFEEELANVEHQSASKMNQIDKKIEVTRHKILVSIESKIKSIEKRLLEKVENILDEKLEKIFNALKISD